jgi:O-antigen/teichoic acid export membrane protein
VAVGETAGILLPPAGDGVERKIAFSAGTQGVARVLHVVLNVADSLIILHYLRLSLYGDYVFVLAVSGFIAITSDLGLTKLAARSASLDEQSGPGVIGTVIMTRVLLALGGIAAAELLLTAAGASSVVRIAVALAGSVSVAQAMLTLFVVFQVRVEQQWEALVRVAMELVELGIVVSLVVARGTFYEIVAAPVLGATVGVLLTAAIVRKVFGFRLGARRDVLAPLARQAVLVGPATLIGVCYLKLDALVIAGFRPPRELALYGAAFQPVEYLLLASAVVVDILFPLLTRARRADPARFGALYGRGTEALVALALPVAVVTAFYAPHVVEAAFGGRYARSAAPLRILTWALLFMVLNTWHGFVFLAGGLPRIPLYYQGAGLVANVVIDLVLIGRIGYLAVAWGTLVTSALITIASVLLARRLLPAVLDPLRMARVLAASGLLAGALGLATTLGVEWFAAALLATVAYPALLAACGVFSLAQARVAILHGLGAGRREAVVRP